MSKRCLFLLLALTAATRVVAASPEYLVGVYYFSGWWREQPNKYITAGQDWRTNYPGRAALLGEYNEPATLDREITAAAANGISFFQILWYPRRDPRYREPHEEKLNEAARLFLASTNREGLKFTVEFVNHPPFDLQADADWGAACREWCAAMKHPLYLRIGGRPVFKIHGAEHFFNQNGRDPARVARRLQTLRQIAADAGLPPPLVSGGVGSGGIASEQVAAPYDFLTTYMEVPPLPRSESPYPYEDLLKCAVQGWERQVPPNAKPYVPFLPAGWDPRPWKDPRPSFRLPDRDQWLDALRHAKAALDKYPRLGVPLGEGKRQKMLLIYAWNEFGEGGIVAPTRGDGDMKLKAIGAVFGTRNLSP